MVDTASNTNSSSDNVLAYPEKLESAATTITGKATNLLTAISYIDNHSETIRDNLTTQAKASFEKYWTKWLAALLNLADLVEGIGILVDNSAIEYLKSDSKILHAFHGDPAAEKQINDQISAIKKQSENFRNKYKQDVDKGKQVENDANKDQHDVDVANKKRDDENDFANSVNFNPFN
jgi:hypothetical protein